MKDPCGSGDAEAVMRSEVERLERERDFYAKESADMRMMCVDERNRAESLQAQLAVKDAEIAEWKEREQSIATKNGRSLNAWLREKELREKAEAELKRWKDCEYESQVKALQAQLSEAKAIAKDANDRELDACERFEKLNKALRAECDDWQQRYSDKSKEFMMTVVQLSELQSENSRLAGLVEALKKAMDAFEDSAMRLRIKRNRRQSIITPDLNWLDVKLEEYRQAKHGNFKQEAAALRREHSHGNTTCNPACDEG